MVKVAINGFGRIGRLAFRQMFGAEGYEVVAINDLTSPSMLAHLLKYDSAQGRYALADTVSADDEAGTITVDGKTIKIYAEKNDVTITYEGGHQEITANREMINELINNLCANAIRYNKKNGSVKVRVDSSQGHPYISVADTGIGISKEHQKRVFERFYRVDKSRSKQTGGTGLGLAIVKHIVALHDAQLNLESEIGKGTTITVTF